MTHAINIVTYCESYIGNIQLVLLKANQVYIKYSTLRKYCIKCYSGSFLSKWV